MHDFFIYWSFCIFCLIILSERSSGADNGYEACSVPVLCGGLNISFPFYIQGLQQAYCGFPGFMLNCSDLGSPVLGLPGNEYVIEGISYTNRNFRVIDSVVLNSNSSSCLPGIRNSTLYTQPQFDYVDVTHLRLFGDCRETLTNDLSKYQVDCGNWDLALYDDGRDKNLIRIALEDCPRNVLVPVDGAGQSGGGNGGIGDVLEVAKKGFELNWTSADCDACEISGGRCGFNETLYKFICFCPDRSHSSSCLRGNKKKRKIIIAAGASVAAVTVAASFVLVVFFRKKLLKSHAFQKTYAKNQVDIELFLKNHGTLAPKMYKYSYLKKITNSFSENLGKGGYGIVYKGKLEDGRLVAVKILSESKGNGEEFMNEVSSISRTSHVNVVALLGFCFDGSKRALIYEFMPNGSLEKFIPNTSSSALNSTLGVDKLFEIVVGIARGLEYLHQGCNTRILHFDIKPHNILLDKDFKPKISDFGLSKLCPNRSSIVLMQEARGTVGYIAPEVFCRNFGEVSHKSDVYSYGMMVLEMVVGRQQHSIDHQGERSTEIYFSDWIYKNLEQNTIEKCVVGSDISQEDEGNTVKRRLIIIGLWCIQTDPKNRPSIIGVIEMLEAKLESLQLPPKPNLSSSPRLPFVYSSSESKSLL
ncbi:LEAF RUST 10 DISEASE-RESISTANCEUS RECEPTOR-LIKE PROTEIN KINASE-like 2.5 isoform X1 [Primulina eburnea]|uniref:LEAF RUST 10 DISEASE-RESISTANCEUS RECEPTOR-LIKE PROTEIN KINASE-like 2.5 isoform X1 n=1 Tax=Primulina eburnea TaxID=1245227 RepID=UPI003C6BE439